jgi:hypothetical protein
MDKRCTITVSKFLAPDFHGSYEIRQPSDVVKEKFLFLYLLWPWPNKKRKFFIFFLYNTEKKAQLQNVAQSEHKITFDIIHCRNLETTKKKEIDKMLIAA